VGFIFKKATDHVDHPIEQAAEQVLSEHGIDIDFSKDKKDKLKNK
jgi:protein-tyrosine-phosphatase